MVHHGKVFIRTFWCDMFAILDGLLLTLSSYITTVCHNIVSDLEKSFSDFFPSKFFVFIFGEQCKIQRFPLLYSFCDLR